MDHIKYEKLSDKRGMRWHPLVIRWSLCTFQRVNTAGWLELREVFNLPGATTIRSRKNLNSTAGIDHEVLKLQEGVSRHCAAARCAQHPPAPTSDESEGRSMLAASH